MRIGLLFKNTFIYGIAAILPRILNLILTPLHTEATNLSQEQYGIYQGIFAYMILGNILLTYGMETAFFRFFNKTDDAILKKKVQSTALTSLVLTTLLFVALTLPLSGFIAHFLNYQKSLIQYSILILALDTLAVIPFAWYRGKGRAINYTFLKIINVFVNLFLNLFFFLGVPYLANANPTMWNWLLLEDKIQYIFIANLIASFITFLTLIPLYKIIKFGFDFSLWKNMFRYGYPILIAGIAFSINEGFDRIFIRELYPADVADKVVGMYAGCYKFGVIMTLFITAYKLGIEPFFFSTSKEDNAPEAYAKVTQYFVIFGSFILVIAGIYTPAIKHWLIRNPDYWEALIIVPVILLSNLCLGIYHSLSVWYKVIDRTWFGAYISIFGGVVTIIANLVLIPFIGYFGSALATLLAYGSMMTISYVLGQKHYPIPYDLKKILTYLGTSIFITGINFYLLDKNYITGTLFVIAFLLVIYHFEKPFFLIIFDKIKQNIKR